MYSSPLLESLIEALRCMPGVGPKSAQRIAIHLLQRDRVRAKHLAAKLLMAMEKIGHCHLCNTFTEEQLCTICNSEKRHQIQQLCIVSEPADVFAIEQTNQFSGLYFVLMGLLSPIDGIGPNEIGLPLLKKRLNQENFKEVILAVRSTIEGDVTANYIFQMCEKHRIPITRIAHGIPVGSDLEMLDGITLSYALLGRQKIEY